MTTDEEVAEELAKTIKRNPQLAKRLIEKLAEDFYDPCYEPLQAYHAAGGGEMGMKALDRMRRRLEKRSQ